MKRLTGVLVFGVFALLVFFPFGAMGADAQSVVVKITKQGLVSDKIIGGAFTEDQGFWNSLSAGAPAQPVMPLAWSVRDRIPRPPYFAGPGAPPPWWVPPRRPPWASPYR